MDRFSHYFRSGEGWSRKATGVTLYLDTFYSPKDEGWYSGIAFSTFKSVLRRESFTAEASFRSYEILLRGGYNWNISNNVSIEPWLGIGPLWADSSLPQIGEERFSELPLQLIGTVHLSYKITP